MQIIYLDDIKRTAWLNGGGFKRDLIKTDDYLISVADITKDGPFSFYEDQQRFFAVLSGAGVNLGTPPVTLTCDSPVHEFAGEQAPACSLVEGDTLDLNLMVKRSRFSGAMKRLARTESPYTTCFSATPKAGLYGVFVMGPTQLVCLSGDIGKTLLIDRPALVFQPASLQPVQWQLSASDTAAGLDAFTLQCISL